MTCLVLIDLQTDQRLIPDVLGDISHQGAMRVRPSFSMVRANLPPDEIRNRAKIYNGRVAVGASEIWNLFPEYRNEFLIRIERSALSGVKHLEVPLKNTILGDVRLDQSISIAERPIYDFVSQPILTRESFEVSDVELKSFPQLIAKEATNISILDKYIYFCEGLSIIGANGSEIAPGVRFLSPAMIFEQTDFKTIVQQRSAMPSHIPPTMAATWPRPYVPEKISGALVVDTPNPDNRAYTDATVNRILSAAALAGAAFGKIPYITRFTAGGWSSNSQDQFANRPYHDRSSLETYTVTTKTPIFSEVVALLKFINPQKFESAKEDFRLLALDTIEDSRRSGVAVLQFAQIWMAIERLLPFRSETTVQLALSLSAFSPAKERNTAFKTLKKSYGLRSEIVHGYSFAKKEPIHPKMSDLSSLFRAVFIASLGTSSSDELKERLMTHVLEGKEGIFGN